MNKRKEGLLAWTFVVPGMLLNMALLTAIIPPSDITAARFMTGIGVGWLLAFSLIWIGWGIRGKDE